MCRGSRGFACQAWMALCSGRLTFWPGEDTTTHRYLPFAMAKNTPHPAHVAVGSWLNMNAILSNRLAYPGN